MAGVLTIALLGSSMTAVAVQADQKKDAAVQTEQKEDSSDKKDDIDDLLQVSVSDKEIGKDENVYLRGFGSFVVKTSPLHWRISPI